MEAYFAVRGPSSALGEFNPSSPLHKVDIVVVVWGQVNDLNSLQLLFRHGGSIGGGGSYGGGGGGGSGRRNGDGGYFSARTVCVWT